LDLAIDHVQRNTSLVDKFGKCKGIENEVGNIAMTSKIHPTLLGLLVVINNYWNLFY